MLIFAELKMHWKDFFWCHFPAIRRSQSESSVSLAR